MKWPLFRICLKNQDDKTSEQHSPSSRPCSKTSSRTTQTLDAPNPNPIDDKLRLKPGRISFGPEKQVLHPSISPLTITESVTYRNPAKRASNAYKHRNSLSFHLVPEAQTMPALSHRLPLEGVEFWDWAKSMRSYTSKSQREDDGPIGTRCKRISFIPENVKGTTKVVLKKDSSATWGLIVSGGADKPHRPRVSNLRPGSPAAECDALTVGDYILSVNGTPTNGLTHESVVGLLRAVEDTIELNVEYEMPKTPSSCNGSVIEKTVSVVLLKENGTFGFTVRGGLSPDGDVRPLLVTHVRPGGPADREGSLKAGDRLIALDGRDLTRCSLSQAQIALQEVEHSATLAIRFDISVMDSVRCGGTPLLVEIERAPGCALGLTLNTARSSFSIYANSVPKNSPVVIESIRTASIAERCGALAIGDTINAVDGLRLEQNNLKEANQILESGQGHKVTLEVVPGRNGIRGRGGNSSVSSPSCTHRFSLYNTLSPTRPLGSSGNRCQRRLLGEATFSSGNAVGVSHAETVRATLLAEGRNVGLILRPPIDGNYPVVADIDPGGAADKSGVICVGDRILGVNGRSVHGLGVSEVTQMMTNTRPTVIIDIEVDVADSVVPSSGTFSVKLSKRQCCLGIRIARGRHRSTVETSDEAILISDIVRGSSAHRSGTLQVGDRILAVDNTRVDSFSVEEARNLLNLENDVVTLKVQKDELCSDDNNNITYSVQLLRDKGVLGISATGTEEPFEPIIVGGIVPGSLAAQTGAIHVGDRLLSINGISLRGKPLSEAIRLLQGNEDTVTLKISRPKNTEVAINGMTPDWIGFHAPPTLSVDSAVESWGSGGIDLPQNTAPSLIAKTDSTPELFRSNCGSTVRRKLSSKHSANGQSREDRKSWGCSSPSSDSGQSDGTDWDKMIADLNLITATCGLREKSILHDANGNIMSSGSSNGDIAPKTSVPSNSSGEVPLKQETSAGNFNNASRRTASPEELDEGSYSVSYATALHSASTSSADAPTPGSSQIFTITLTKDPFYEDFGFSVSDGLYEKGVYVNRVRKGGPAHRCGLLMPYDRILQVNDTQTEDFDCCLTVPLIASAEDTLFLKISRTNGATPSFRLVNELRMNAWLEADEEQSINTSSSFFKHLL